MATIHNLRTSISNMSSKEAYTCIEGIRANRRIIKKKPAKKKMIDVSKVASKLSPQQAQEMLDFLDAR